MFYRKEVLILSSVTINLISEDTWGCLTLTHTDGVSEFCNTKDSEFQSGFEFNVAQWIIGQTEVSWPDLLDESVDVLRQQQSTDGDTQSSTHCRLRLGTHQWGQEAAGRVLTETTEEESMRENTTTSHTYIRVSVPVDSLLAPTATLAGSPVTCDLPSATSLVSNLLKHLTILLDTTVAPTPVGWRLPAFSRSPGRGPVIPNLYTCSRQWRTGRRFTVVSLLYKPDNKKFFKMAARADTAAWLSLYIHHFLLDIQLTGLLLTEHSYF